MDNPNIALNLPFNDVQRIVAQLETLPYREVAPLITSIVNQTNPQLLPQTSAVEDAAVKDDAEVVPVPEAEQPA